MNSPSKRSFRQISQRPKATILLHILLIVELILPLLGEKSIETVTAAPILPVTAQSLGSQAIINPSLPTFSWAAYNDTFVGAGEPNSNITNVRLSSRSDGNALKNYSDGSTIAGITFEVRVGTNTTASDELGAEANPGTDAHSTFHSIAQMAGSVAFKGSSSSVTLTFTGLNPAKTYTFTTTANSGGGLNEELRATKFTLGNYERAVNLSSAGTNILTTTLADDTTVFSTGNNTGNGYIARWVNINPGTDGIISLTATSAVTSNYAYGPSVFMLAEEDAIPNCQTATLAVTEDTFLSANGEGFNYGNSVSLEIANGTDNLRRTALLKWNLAGIPTTVAVSSARITVYVITTSKVAFSLFNLRRPWIPGTSNGTVGSGANWTATGIDAETWAGAGASDATMDRYDVNLWNSTNTSFTTPSQPAVIPLNTNGVNVINDWLHGTTSNYGLIIQTYGGTFDNLIISSSEAAVANRPTLTLAYCTPTGVDINYFRAARTPKSVQLSWETVNEATLAGFNLYRRELDGKFGKLNPVLIPPERGGQPEGYAYIYQDETAALDLSYEYRLEAIETSLEPSASLLAAYWPYSLQLPIIQH